jgi:hypothetical protein
MQNDVSRREEFWIAFTRGGMRRNSPSSRGEIGACTRGLPLKMNFVSFVPAMAFVLST